MKNKNKYSARVGGAISLCMDIKDISQKTLSLKMGIQQPEVSRLLSGVVIIDVYQLSVIAQILEVKVTALLGLAGDA
jgi:transcriptional regulator with XRE-family HTH domain